MNGKFRTKDKDMTMYNWPCNLHVGVFDSNEYFDVEVEYVTDSESEALYCCYTVTNRGGVEKELSLIPQFWFRYALNDIKIFLSLLIAQHFCS